MRINEFSKKVGISAYTLRFYEKEGLINPNRNAQGYRNYDEKDVQWIDFIQRLKATNMPIKQIKIYAKLRYQGDDTLAERYEMLTQHEQKLEQEIEQMLENLKALKEKKAIYREMIKDKKENFIKNRDEDIVEIAKQRLANIQSVKVDINEL